ncbi:MAG: glycosyltransferase family 39 protein [Candidatus Hydrogenedentes bacterium]|mgnify:CR=1 FL=1|nr:glycosyltransferase family 39 protein [Candidatus Hydrogenedentota bacterium]
MKNGWAWLHAALVVMLLLLAAGVRLYRLDEESLWLDENITWDKIESPGLQDYISQLRTRDTTFVPAYYAILYYFGKVSNHNVTAARALSVGFGMLTVLLVYLIARRAFGPSAGIAALLMAAFSNTHVYYAQEIRVYALYSTAALLSIWTLENALRQPHFLKWAAHLCANALLVFSHYFGALFLITEGCYLLLFHRASKKRLAGWFFAQAILALLLGLWMLGIRRDVLEVTTGFLQVPKAETIEYALTWTALYWPRFLYPLSFLSRILLDMILLLGFYCYWTRQNSGPNNRRWQQMVVYVLLMVAPVVAALAACYLVRPVLTLRYVIPASLLFFILVGGAVGSLPSRPLRWGAVVLLACLMGAHHLEAARPYRPNLKTAGAILNQSQSPNDGLVLESVVDAFARRRYIQFPEERTIVCASKEDLLGSVASLLTRHAVVWVLCEFGYSRNYASLEELEAVLKQGDTTVERMELSSGHYTFMTNSNWPDLSDIGQSIVLYRVSGARLEERNQERNILPAAISIFSS